MRDEGDPGIAGRLYEGERERPRSEPGIRGADPEGLLKVGIDGADTGGGGGGAPGAAGDDTCRN